MRDDLLVQNELEREERHVYHQQSRGGGEHVEEAASVSLLQGLAPVLSGRVGSYYSRRRARLPAGWAAVAKNR